MDIMKEYELSSCQTVVKLKNWLSRHVSKETKNRFLYRNDPSVPRFIITTNNRTLAFVLQHNTIGCL